MAELPVLDVVDQRVLGSLLEKERTVPGSYPLSLNALRTACNQASSREPVTDYDDAALEACARDLKQRELLRIVWAGKGSRTLKYHQLLSERLALEEGERALLTVLLLRGPQAAGELRTRTERLHAFGDRAEVEETLAAMAARPEPLVVELERRPGQHDPRWAHLLGPLPSATDGAEPVVAVDREAVLASGADARDAAVRAAYDAVATDYAAHHEEQLEHQPVDRFLLEHVAELATGPVVDAGCGPGHVAAFLADTGVAVTGLDVSPGMVEAARQSYPDMTFQAGDLRRLLKPPADAGWGAVVAWFSLVHLAPSELPEAIGALGRTLAPGGFLALALFVGDEVRHLDEWWGHQVDLDVVHHDADDVRAAVAAAGLTVVEDYERAPLAGVEEPVRRLYLLARP